MKTLVPNLLTALGTLCSSVSLFAQTTAFTYQGQLRDGTNTANGSYDLVFDIYNASSGGSAQATSLTNSAVSVNNGLFTVVLDFGGVFPGSDRWLQISIRTNGTGLFSTLSPRQRFFSAPYAITAANLSGTIPAGQLSGTLSSAQLSGTYSAQVTFANSANSFSGNGGGLTNINALTLGGLSSSAFWKTTGNLGTSPTNENFLGTIDNQPLELRVNNTRGWRMEPTTNSPNIIGGWANNLVGNGAAGTTIGGGGSLYAEIMDSQWTSSYYTNQPNAIFADFGTIGGGLGNQIGIDQPSFPIESRAATIGGGLGNYIRSAGNQTSGATGSTIGGGIKNGITGQEAEGVCNTIAGGFANLIARNATYATVAGGSENLIIYGSSDATIGGGQGNFIDGSGCGTIAGGLSNSLAYLSGTSAIGGGNGNAIGTEQLLFGAGACTISGGVANWIQGGCQYACIGGGVSNVMQNIGVVGESGGTIAGGGFNTIAPGAEFATISGGSANQVNGTYGIVPGGRDNTATNFAFAAGSFAQATNQGAFVWADSKSTNFTSVRADEFAVRATGGVRFVSAVDSAGNPIAGVRLDPAATSWATISDRNAKKDFIPVDPDAMLQKLNRVSVGQWRYKWESEESIPHIGPMAQDFKQAFYPGRDDKSITTLEFDGVELAAIQGLNRKLEQQAEVIRQKDARIANLEERLERLEAAVLAVEQGP